MKRHLKNPFLSLILLLLIFCSCSKKPAQTTTTLRLSGMSSGHSALLGYEVMIYGVNRDNGDSFGKIFNGSSLSLSNGNWTFLVAAWNGPAMANASTLNCGKVSVSLNGGDQSVAIHLAQSVCESADFGPANTRDSGGPLQTKFYTLANKECFAKEGNQECYRGVSRSYQVSLLEFENSSLKTSGVVSQCVNHTDDEISFQSDIRVPIFTPQNSKLRVAYRISSFYEEDCAGERQAFMLPNGFLSPVKDRAEINIGGSNLGPDENAIYVRPNICAKPTVEATGFTFSAGATVGSRTHYICGQSQFMSLPTFMVDSLHQTETYILGESINFNGASVPSVGTFRGKLLGLGHALQNFVIDGDANNAALFSEIMAEDLDQVVIKDIIFDNPVLHVNAVWSSGILGGYMSGPMTLKNLKFNSPTVNINNSTGSNIYKVGVIGGQLNSFGYLHMDISDLELNNVLFNIPGNDVNEVGGVFGRLVDQEGPLRLSKVHINNIRFNTAGSTEGLEIMGGFAGAASDTQLDEVIITGLSFNNQSFYEFNADFAIGGFIGLSYGDVTIRNSSVTGDISLDPIPCGACGNDIGGAIGNSAYGESSLYNVVVDVSVASPNNSGDSGVGGVVGMTGEALRLISVRSFGNISGVSNVGGLIGRVDVPNLFVEIEESYSRGNVMGTGSAIGGAIGYFNVSLGYTNFTKVFSSGDVTGVDEVGGLIGHWVSGEIMYSASYGSVSADDLTGSAGALIGKSESTDFGNTFVNLYSSSIVSSGYEKSVINYVAAPGPSGDPTCYFNGVLNPVTDAYCVDVTSLAAPLDANIFVASNWDSGVFPNFKFNQPLLALGEKVLGTDSMPFLINSIAAWNSVGADPFLMTKTFRLANDLDFAGETFIPWASDSISFYGVLQGNNRTIRNINYTGGIDELNIGLIKSIASDDSTQKDTGVYHRDSSQPKGYRTLTLENNHFYATEESAKVGILAGEIQMLELDGSSLSLQGIRIVGGELGGADAVSFGGLAAELFVENSQYARIHDIESSVVINDCGNSFSNHAGGLFGKAYSNTTEFVRLSAIKSNVSVTSDCQAPNIGGLIGSVENVAGDFRIEQAIFEGSLDGELVGGFVGMATGQSMSIDSSISRGVLNATAEVGGFIGRSDIAAAGLYLEGLISLSEITYLTTITSGLILGTASAGIDLVNSYSYSPSSNLSAIGAASLVNSNCSNVYNVSSHALGTQNCAGGTFLYDISFAELIDQGFVALPPGDPFFFDGVNRPMMYYELFSQFFYTN